MKRNFWYLCKDKHKVVYFWIIFWYTLALSFTITIFMVGIVGWCDKESIGVCLDSQCYIIGLRYWFPRRRPFGVFLYPISFVLRKFIIGGQVNIFCWDGHCQCLVYCSLSWRTTWKQFLHLIQRFLRLSRLFAILFVELLWPWLLFYSLLVVSDNTLFLKD